MTTTTTTLGDCFAVAATLTLDRPTATLVHGHPVLRGDGPHAGTRYWHAWVEVDGMALDHSNGLNVRLPVAVYYALGKIDPSTCLRYPSDTVAETLLTWGHYGPWNDDYPPVNG